MFPATTTCRHFTTIFAQPDLTRRNGLSAHTTLEGVINAEERRASRAAGFGQPSDIVRHPALLIIDVQYRNTGTSPPPFRESIKKFPTSCGKIGWNAMHNITHLLAEYLRSRLNPNEAKVSAILCNRTLLDDDMTRLLGFVVCIFMASSALAQTCPDKPIRIGSPWAAGGPAEALGRIIGSKVSEALGQPIVIDSRPGADGMGARLTRLPLGAPVVWAL